MSALCRLIFFNTFPYLLRGIDMAEEKRDVDIVSKIAEKFEREALEFIESEVSAAEGGEELSERARETVKGVVTFCIEEAKRHSRSPEEFQNEFRTCVNEWFSTIMLITNRFLKKAVREARKK